MTTKDPISHQPMTLRPLLRNATHHHHVKLNHHPLLTGLMKPNYPSSDYHTLLLAYFRLYQLLEDRIRQFLHNQSTTFNYDERCKLPWLINDLTYFQIDPFTASSSIQKSLQFPAIESIGQLIGILYVLEGSTLGGQAISKIIVENYDFTPNTGGCFFSGYGEKTPSLWQGFITFADTLSNNPQQCLAAETAANQVFQLFNTVLDDAILIEHTQHNTL